MINLKDIKTTNFNNLRISILGAGKSGIGAAKLAKHLGCKVLISDNSKKLNLNQKINQIEYELGCHTSKVLNADLIIKSPGIPNNIEIIKKIKSKNIPIISEIEFASWFTNSNIMALTGSNGKTTTVQLLHEMCLSDGEKSLLGGNVGIPFSENVLLELTSNFKSIIHVLELSSFQLEHIFHFSPNISGLLNISEDHMDRYNSFDEYIEKKLILAKRTKLNGSIIYNQDDPILQTQLANIPNGIMFSLKKNNHSIFNLNESKMYISDKSNLNILFHLKDTKLKGSHNLQNILAATNMAYAYGISINAIRDTIVNFTPVNYRLEWIGNINGVDYFNDSKATNIAAAKAAIKSFNNNLLLILGGSNKGLTNFKQLSNCMQERVRKIIAYGEAGKSIEAQLKKEFDLSYNNNFEDAIIEAHKLSQPGDTVLLSPACASFDQFDNYVMRGKEFNRIFSDLELNQ